MALWKEAHLHHVLGAPLQVSYHSVDIAILPHYLWAALELPFIPWTCTIQCCRLGVNRVQFCFPNFDSLFSRVTHVKLRITTSVYRILLVRFNTGRCLRLVSQCT
jgi:hypothetical protein